MRAQTPTLFVPVDAQRYDKMVERANNEPYNARFENGHTCADGAARDGVWVPLSWWEGKAQ